MQSHDVRHVSMILGASISMCLGVAAIRAAAPIDLITPADIEEVVGRSAEPDQLDGGQTVVYTVVDPATGAATTVQVYLETPADWKQLEALRDAAEMAAEQYEEVAEIGDAAVYRWRDDEGNLSVEKAAASGARTWIHIGVIDAGDADAARRIATELGRRAVAKL